MPSIASRFGLPSMSESSKHVPLFALFREIPPQGTAAVHTEHAYLRMSESTVICKTQWMVNIQHQLGARSDVPFKLHKTLQNQRGAVYAAFNLPHWDFLAFAGDRPAIDEDIQGTCRLRQLPLLLLQNRPLRPDLVP